MIQPFERITRDHDKFPDFCRYMVDEGMEMADLLYMIQKPSHWQVEWNVFIRANETQPECDEPYTEDSHCRSRQQRCSEGSDCSTPTGSQPASDQMQASQE